jgi:prophage antirepressor-like protein
MGNLLWRGGYVMAKAYEFNFIDEMNCKEFGNIRYISIYEPDKGHSTWFVGKDVATALGYEKPDNMYRLIDEEDQVMINPQTIAEGYINWDKMEKLEVVTVANARSLTKRGIVFEDNPNTLRMILINESGFYTAALSSRQPNSKKFKRWVTSEVLPSIRMNGYYMSEELYNEIFAGKIRMENYIKKLRHQRLLEKGVKFAEWFEDNPNFVAWRDEMNEGLDEICKFKGLKNRTSALFEAFKLIWKFNHISLDDLRSKFVDAQILTISHLGYDLRQEDYDAFTDFDRLYCIYSDIKFRRIFSEYVIDRKYIAMNGETGFKEVNTVSTMDSFKLW